MNNRLKLVISFIMMIAIIAIGLLTFFVGKKRNQPKHLTWFAITCIALGITSLFELIFQIESRGSGLNILSTAVFSLIIMRFAKKRSEKLYKIVYRVVYGLFIFTWIASYVASARQFIYALQSPLMELVESLKIGLPLAIGFNAGFEDDTQKLPSELTSTQHQS